MPVVAVNVSSASPSPAVLRHSRLDAVLVALAVFHGVLLLLASSILLIAIGLWWNSNTIAHNFIHRPFFRSRALDAVFSAYLSLLLGFPQTLWRERHLAHHGGVAWRPRFTPRVAMESTLVAGLWIILATVFPAFLLKVYLPGYLVGMFLCHLQGHYEHARGTTSHYGRLYNLLFFNDGYHVEHHERPAEHWTRLPTRKARGATASRWPAVLRWIEYLSLDSLERLVLRVNPLQRYVLKKHERAFRALLPRLSAAHRVAIVGGGIFPRTALILQRLLPDASLTIIDSNAENLNTAKPFLRGGVEFVNGFDHSVLGEGFDLVVIPLSYIGDRTMIYEHPPATAVLVHDWMWRRRGEGVIISLLLLKRLNLVKQ